jgi:hypothetical protein
LVQPSSASAVITAAVTDALGWAVSAMPSAYVEAKTRATEMGIVREFPL